MRACAKCGHYNSPDSIFCGHCANRLNNNCPGCGFQNLREQKFCGNCGKQLLTDPVVKDTAQPSETGQYLSAYALISVECLYPKTMDYQALDILKTAIIEGGGQISTIRSNILFVVFKGVTEAMESLAQALRLSQYLLSPAFDIRDKGGGEFLSLRIGLAIEQANARNPLTSTPERSVAEAGDLVLGSAVYELIPEPGPQWSRLEPVKIGNHTMDFYRWRTLPERSISQKPYQPLELAEVSTPSATPVGAPQPVSQTETRSFPKSDEKNIAEKNITPKKSTQESFTKTSSSLATLQTPAQVLLEKDMRSSEPNTRIQLPQTIQSFTQSEQVLQVQTLRPAQEMPAPKVQDSPDLETGMSQKTTTRPSPEVNVEKIPEAHHQESSQSQGISPAQAPLPSASRPSTSDFLSQKPGMEAVSELPSPDPPDLNVPKNTKMASFSTLPETAHEGSPSPLETNQKIPTQIGLTEPESSEEVPFPQYEPPLLGRYQAPRRANLNYQNASDTLSADLDAFLTLEGKAEAPKKGVRGKVIALCGADGLGKSSLIHMARMKVDPKNQRAIWMGGYFYRSFQQTPLPLYYWIEILLNLLSLLLEGQGNADAKEHLQKFLSHLPENSVSKEMLNFFNDLLLIHPPKPLSVESRHELGRIEQFFGDFFRCLAQRRPLILVMEDIMFADPASLEVLIRLLENNLLHEPFYLILTQRRDFYAQGPLADILKKIPYQELVVEELSASETERFLDEGPLGGQLLNFPPDLVKRVIQTSKGLPLYLEETLRLLHLQDVLVVDPLTSKFVMNTAQYAGRETSSTPIGNLPDNFTDVLQARLTFLSEKSRYILHLAAVLGEKFPVNILMSLSQMEEVPFNEAMTLLFSHGLLLPDAINTGRFRHGLIWEAIYYGMNATLRVQMHQLISELLENDSNQGLTVSPLIMAYHSEQAQMPNRAINHWNLSGIYAAHLGSLTGMNLALFKAMQLSENRPLEPALRAMESLGVFNLDENPAQAVAMLDWVIFYRKSEGAPLKLIEPLGFLSTAHRNQGDFPKALSALEQAVTCVDPKRYPLEVVSLQINMLEYLYTLGRFQTFRELMDEQIVPLVSEHGYGPDTSSFQESYLQAHLWKGQVMLAQCETNVETFIRDGIKQAQEQGFSELILSFKLLLGQYALCSGQYPRCNEEASQLLGAIEAFGNSNRDTDWLLAQWGLLAMQYHCAMQDWTSASQLILTVTTKAEGIRDYQTWVMAQVYAGHITAKLGKVSEGRQLIEKALELSAQYRFMSTALIGWRLLAELEGTCQNTAVAIEIADRAIAMANKPEVQNHYEAYQLTLLSASLTLAQPDNKSTIIKAAGKRLEELWPKIAKTHFLPLIAACAYEIGFLYKQMAQNVPADLSRKYLTRSVEFLKKAKSLWSELKLTTKARQVDQVMPTIPE